MLFRSPFWMRVWCTRSRLTSVRLRWVSQCIQGNFQRITAIYQSYSARPSSRRTHRGRERNPYTTIESTSTFSSYRRIPLSQKPRTANLFLGHRPWYIYYHYNFPSSPFWFFHYFCCSRSIVSFRSSLVHRTCTNLPKMIRTYVSPWTETAVHPPSATGSC